MGTLMVIITDVAFCGGWWNLASPPLNSQLLDGFFTHASAPGKAVRNT